MNGQDEDSKPPIGPKELKPLMYWAGLALNACQQFEYGLKLLLWTMARVGYKHAIPLPEATAIIEDEVKKTLGQLLTLLRTKCTISDGWSASLEHALDARNNIIHHFLIDNVERIVDPGRRHEVLAELKQLRKTVLAGDEVVRLLVTANYAFLGLDADELHRQFCEEIRIRNLKQ